MNDITTTASPKRRHITLFAGGCLGVLYFALCFTSLMFSRVLLADKNAPMPTATITPVAHILVGTPSDESKVIYEDFTSNKNDWGLYFDSGKLEVINGKLILQSGLPNGIGAGINQRLSPASEKYYIQADFSTDIATISSYGLMFGLNKSLYTYYVFEIWPQSTSFQLLKSNAGKWTELLSPASAKLNPYPRANTLSISFDKGNIELYINGESAAKYYDKDYFQSKEMGIFVNNTGYQLFVDDLFMYDEK